MQEDPIDPSLPTELLACHTIESIKIYLIISVISPSFFYHTFDFVVARDAEFLDLKIGKGDFTHFCSALILVMRYDRLDIGAFIRDIVVSICIFIITPVLLTNV